MSFTKKSTGLGILAFTLLACGQTGVHVKSLPGDQTAQKRIADESCQKFKDKLPKDYIQDTIEVPEDPATPDGRKINVFYYGKIKAGVTPTVFFNGGPGSDSHGSYRGFAADQWKLDPNQDVSMIYIDQRGNGCSDYYPQVAETNHPDAETLKRLSFYGTRGIVADAEAIRKKLIGDQQWIAFGQSYGSFIVHRYIEIAAQSLKAGFGHANTINSDGYTRVKNRIYSQVRVMEMYLKDYPDDAAPLALLQEKLTQKTCFADPKSPQKACGAQVLEIIPATFLGFADSWPDLHEWVQIMVQNQKIRMDGVNLFLKNNYFSPNNLLNNKRWASQVITWVDRNQPPVDALTCTRMNDELKTEKNIDLKSAYTECMIALQFAGPKPTDSSLLVQSLAKDTLTLEHFANALKANPKLQFYWYSGEKDTYVPVENFKEEKDAVSSLENVHYTHFTGTGHDGFKSEPKVWLDLIKESKGPGAVDPVLTPSPTASPSPSPSPTPVQASIP